MRGFRPARSGRRRPEGLLLVALSAMVLLAAACGESTSGSGATGSNAGATGTTVDLGPPAKATGAPIRIGQITDGKWTGADQSFEKTVIDATAAYLNEYENGLAGHEIQIVTCVDQGDPARATDCANQMVKEEVAAVIGGELAAGENIFQPLHDAKIPVIYYAAGSRKVLLDSETSFVMASATAPLMDVPRAAAEAAGKKKVTVVVIDVPAAVGVYEALGPKMFGDAGLELALVKIPPGTADMTPQMQTLTASDPGDVHILGTDAFCIAALNGLEAVGYDGPRSMVGQCLTDATHKAIPGSDLEGIRVSESSPVGSDDKDLAIFDALMAKGGITDQRTLDRGISTYIPIVALARVLDEHTGELTSASITAAMKGMPQMVLPASGGLFYRCNGKASALAPATCVRGTLMTVLGADGEPTTFEQVGNTPIE